MRLLRDLFLPAVACAALLTACSNPTTAAPVSYTYTLSASEAWAGSTINIHSAAFKTHDSTAVLYLGDSVVALARVDDTTMKGTLPQSLGGSVSAYLRVDSIRTDLPSLMVDGYLDLRTYGFQDGWNAIPVFRNGHAGVITGTTTTPSNSGGGTALDDLETGTITTIDSTWGELSGLRGPGVTWQDGVFVLDSAANPVVNLWNLATVPTKVGPAPVPTWLANSGDLSFNQVAWLSPNVWFDAGHHQYSTYFRADSTQPWTTVVNNVAAEMVESVYLSPTKDRAVFDALSYTGDNGVPVLNTATGSVAYVVAGIHALNGAAFSPDGSELALVGTPGSQFSPTTGTRLVLLNASNGAIVKDTSASVSLFALRFDPVRPLLYVGVTDAAGVVSILVLDRSTFKVLGTMKVPSTALNCAYTLGCAEGQIVLGGAQNGNTGTLFVYWGFNGTARAWRFALPAGSGEP